MAKRKRTKKEAQERIPRLAAPPLPPPLRNIPAIGVPLRALKAAELGARALIELDPLNRLDDGSASQAMQPRVIGRTSAQALADVVNDPAIVVDEAMMQVINDPRVAMADNGEVMIRANADTNGGLDPGFVRDFRRRATDVPKRKRKKNPKLAAAFREANKRYRTKSGKLRKGRTQADIARLAHRLLKKM